MMDFLFNILSIFISDKFLILLNTAYNNFTIYLSKFFISHIATMILIIFLLLVLNIYLVIQLLTLKKHKSSALEESVTQEIENPHVPKLIRHEAGYLKDQNNNTYCPNHSAPHLIGKIFARKYRQWGYNCLECSLFWPDNSI